MTAPSPRDTFITIYGRKPVLEALAAGVALQRAGHDIVALALTALARRRRTRAS